MEFSVVDGILNIKLNLIVTTALACVLLMSGYYVRHKISFFEKFCFPAPVIGGFIFALLALLFKVTNTVIFTLDTTLQTPFMLVFFTTIGLGGSLALIKKGGKALVIYLLVCWAVAFLQNGFGVSLALLLGLEALMGVAAGSVSLEGGHGAAAAFGPLMEQRGVQGAYVVAIASATFGLMAGSLTGGPLAHWLIKSNKLKIQTAGDGYDISYDEMVAKEQVGEQITAKEFLRMLTLIGVIMSLGIWVVDLVTSADNKTFSIPAYVGAMFIAILFRNINDRLPLIRLNSKTIDLLSDVTLGLFLTMAMMSLKIWELSGLALPLVIILVLQVLLLLSIARFILFPALGRDYDAAVICAGLMGHGLGATPNAVANMGAVGERYGLRSEKAFLIVPLCGAVLIDFVGIPCIVAFINFFAPV
ncbi:MAG: sodium/glutamate symporter [Enterobacteriaceae bacterium]